MQRKSFGGVGFEAKDGVIEHLGDSLVSFSGTTYASMRFADGESLRNVTVDPQLGRFVGIGLGGRFVFTRLGRGLALVGVEIEGIGMRAGDAGYWARKAHSYYVQGAGALVLGLIFAVFLIGVVFVLASPFAFFAGHVFARAATAAKHLGTLAEPARATPSEPATLALEAPLAQAA